MKLLIITQKVDQNDDLLGFFPDWICEFSKSVKKIFVISLSVGEYHLPANIEVYSLGKEKGRNKFFRYLKFYQLIFKLLPRIDNVFAHMCPEYIIALWPVNLFFNKKIFLWYVHRQVNWRLKLAEKFVKKIFTVSPESCQIKSDKITILGHGIDLDLFKSNIRAKTDNFFDILYVGRISRIKNQQLLIKAADVLINQKSIKNIKITLVGGPILTVDNQYLNSLKKLIIEYHLENYVEITGRLPFNKVINYYQGADLSINLAPTGGLDKTVLESMAMGLPIIVLNQSFKQTLGDYQSLILEKADEQSLADKISQLINLDNEARAKMGNYLREQINQYHNLNNLIENLIREMS